MSRVIIFDVEHGFCAFVKSPTGCTLMIDCGRKGAFSPVVYVLNNELNGTLTFNGYRLTQLLITHPHDDHIEDIQAVSSKLPPYILQRQQYNWENVKDGEGDYEHLDCYKEWQRSYNAPVNTAPDWGMDIQVFALTPTEAEKVNPNNYVNNSGMVVVLTIPGTRFREKFVFGADVEADGWDALLKKPEFSSAVSGADFFVVPHHGHSSGFSPVLYAAMGNPILNLISVTSGDEHVDPAYCGENYALGTLVGDEKRYSLTTRTDGSIFVDVDAEGRFLVRTFELADNELLVGLAALLGRL